MIAKSLLSEIEEFLGWPAGWRLLGGGLFYIGVAIAIRSKAKRFAADPLFISTPNIWFDQGRSGRLSRFRFNYFFIGILIPIFLFVIGALGLMLLVARVFFEKH